MDKRAFKSLVDYLEKTPSIQKNIFFDSDEEGFWWIKFKIDITNKFSWNVVQELGCVINYLSINERLPSVFYPVSPAPYLNGGPENFLSWVIETKDPEFKPETLMKWLEVRLPNPVDDYEQWEIE
tara:strand:+ start:393 stop:767 length:375 start_codon:yes stop_codon:yes gene_type:complete